MSYPKTTVGDLEKFIEKKLELGEIDRDTKIVLRVLDDESGDVNESYDKLHFYIGNDINSNEALIISDF